MPDRRQPDAAGAVWTCPMHPQLRQDHPGACPFCGMALEPELASADSGPSAENCDMLRRCWIAAGLTLPVFLLAMGVPDNTPLA